MGRDRRRNTAAIRRVEADGPVPLGELVALSGAKVGRMIEWVVRGRLGVHLDAFKDRVTGRWCSSAAAVARFVAEVAREEEHRAELEADRLAELASRGVAEGDATGLARPEKVWEKERVRFPGRKG